MYHTWYNHSAVTSPALLHQAIQGQNGSEISSKNIAVDALELEKTMVLSLQYVRWVLSFDSLRAAAV